MQIIWTAQAKASLKEIADFIALDNRKRGLQFAEKIYSKSKILADFPEIGRAGNIGSTREIVAHKNYIMVYRIRKNAVEILYVYHSARNW